MNVSVLVFIVVFIIGGGLSASIFNNEKSKGFKTNPHARSHTFKKAHDEPKKLSNERKLRMTTDYGSEDNGNGHQGADKGKRCPSRNDMQAAILESTHNNPKKLVLARREVGIKRMCNICRETAKCKKYNKCESCQKYCGSEEVAKLDNGEAQVSAINTEKNLTGNDTNFSKTATDLDNNERVSSAVIIEEDDLPKIKINENVSSTNGIIDSSQNPTAEPTNVFLSTTPLLQSRFSETVEDDQNDTTNSLIEIGSIKPDTFIYYSLVEHFRMKLRDIEEFVVFAKPKSGEIVRNAQNFDENANRRTKEMTINEEMTNNNKGEEAAIKTIDENDGEGEILHIPIINNFMPESRNQHVVEDGLKSSMVIGNSINGERNKKERQNFFNTDHLETHQLSDGDLNGLRQIGDLQTDFAHQNNLDGVFVPQHQNSDGNFETHQLSDGDLNSLHQNGLQTDFAHQNNLDGVVVPQHQNSDSEQKNTEIKTHESSESNESDDRGKIEENKSANSKESAESKETKQEMNPTKNREFVLNQRLSDSNKNSESKESDEDTLKNKTNTVETNSDESIDSDENPVAIQVTKDSTVSPSDIVHNELSARNSLENVISSTNTQSDNVLSNEKPKVISEGDTEKHLSDRNEESKKLVDVFTEIIKNDLRGEENLAEIESENIHKAVSNLVSKTINREEKTGDAIHQSLNKLEDSIGIKTKNEDSIGDIVRNADDIDESLQRNKKVDEIVENANGEPASKETADNSEHTRDIDDKDKNLDENTSSSEEDAPTKKALIETVTNILNDRKIVEKIDTGVINNALNGDGQNLSPSDIGGVDKSTPNNDGEQNSLLEQTPAEKNTNSDTDNLESSNIGKLRMDESQNLPPAAIAEKTLVEISGKDEKDAKVLNYGNVNNPSTSESTLLSTPGIVTDQQILEASKQRFSENNLENPTGMDIVEKIPADDGVNKNTNTDQSIQQNLQFSSDIHGQNDDIEKEPKNEATTMPLKKKKQNAPIAQMVQNDNIHKADAAFMDRKIKIYENAMDSDKTDGQSLNGDDLKLQNTHQNDQILSEDTASVSKNANGLSGDGQENSQSLLEGDNQNDINKKYDDNNNNEKQLLTAGENIPSKPPLGQAQKSSLDDSENVSNNANGLSGDGQENPQSLLEGDNQNDINKKSDDNNKNGKQLITAGENISSKTPLVQAQKSSLDDSKNVKSNNEDVGCNLEEKLKPVDDYNLQTTEKHRLLNDGQINRLIQPLYGILHAKDDAVNKMKPRILQNLKSDMEKALPYIDDNSNYLPASEQDYLKSSLNTRGDFVDTKTSSGTVDTLYRSSDGDNNDKSRLSGANIDWAYKNDEERPQSANNRLDYFGKLVFANDRSTITSYDGKQIDKPAYFIGNGIKLPLIMKQESDGSLQLTVDLEKLCSNCKEKVCKNKLIEDSDGNNNLNSEGNNEKLEAALEKEMLTDTDDEKAERKRRQLIVKPSPILLSNDIAIGYKTNTNKLPNGESEEDDEIVQKTSLKGNVRRFGKGHETDNVIVQYSDNEQENDKDFVQMRLGLVKKVLSWMKNIAVQADDDNQNY